MSQKATPEDGGFGMSQDDVQSLWKSIDEIKDILKENRKELQQSLAAIKDNCIKIAKIEQRLENGVANAASSRQWVGMAVAWFLTISGWAITIILFLLKK